MRGPRTATGTVNSCGMPEPLMPTQSDFAGVSEGGWRVRRPVGIQHGGLAPGMRHVGLTGTRR